MEQRILYHSVSRLKCFVDKSIILEMIVSLVLMTDPFCIISSTISYYNVRLLLQCTVGMAVEFIQRFDHRPFLYNVRWTWQFSAIDDAVQRLFIIGSVTYFLKNLCVSLLFGLLWGEIILPCSYRRTC